MGNGNGRSSIGKHEIRSHGIMLCTVGTEHVPRTRTRLVFYHTIKRGEITINDISRIIIQSLKNFISWQLK